MNRRILTLASLCIISAARADLVIEQEVEATGQPKQTMTMSFKDGKIRADIGKAMTTITDSATGDSTAIMHEQKMIMVTSGAASKAAVEAAQKMLTGTEKPKKLDKTKTIDGRSCEGWAYEIGGSKTTMWVDKAYPGYADFKAEMDKLTSAQQKNAAANFDLGGMVVKTESVMAGISSISTVKSVKQTKLDASIFDKPTGYTEMNLGK
jgi:hypothetical protein